MRLLMFSHRPNNHRVVRRDADFMLEAAAKLVAEGHRVWMLYTGRLSRHERTLHDHRGLRYVEYDGDIERPRATLDLMSHIRDLRIDVTLAQWECTYTLSLAALLCGVKRRWLRVNSFPWMGGSSTFASRQRNRILYRWLTNEVVTCSDALTRTLVETFRLDDDRVHTVHPGIRVPDGEPHLVSVADGGTADGRTVLTVAVLFPHKGHVDLIRAMPDVVRRHSDVTFRFVGGGVLQPQLEREAEALGVRDHVVFEGSRSVADVLELNREASLFVLPSRSEGFGYVMLEAMACGNPVVATRVGGIPEVVAEGRTGLLVEPRRPDQLSAAIDRLLAYPETARAMGLAGRQRLLSAFDVTRQGALLARLLRTGASDPVTTLSRPPLDGVQAARGSTSLRARD